MIDYLTIFGLLFVTLFWAFIMIMYIIRITQNTILFPLVKYTLVPAFLLLDWTVDKLFWPIPVIGGKPLHWTSLVTDRVSWYKYMEPKGSIKNKFGVYVCKLLDKIDFRGDHCNALIWKKFPK